MEPSFINIKNIISTHISIILQDKQRNTRLFFVYPGILALFLSWLFYADTAKVIEILSLFLSIFIPLFISLLATILSFVMNKIKTRHNKERIPLIKETFYNICYLIPLSLALLVLSLLMSLSLGKESYIEFSIFSINIKWTINFVYIYLLGCIFYSGIIHMIMNILMITKRIFILFDKEIDLLSYTNNDNDNDLQKSTDTSIVDDEEDLEL